MSELLPLTLITTGTIEGDGAFDVLMRGASAQIKEEYKANRIKGNEYATVYLGCVQACLQLAMQYALQKDKTIEEIAILAAKKATEQAQTQAGIADPESVVGRQNALYKAQTDGYQRDAEQRAAKIVTDIMAIQMGVTDYEATDANRIKDPYLGGVLERLYQGINATPTATP